jgi:hypothetical protein
MTVDVAVLTPTITLNVIQRLKVENLCRKKLIRNTLAISGGYVLEKFGSANTNLITFNGKFV